MAFFFISGSLHSTSKVAFISIRQPPGQKIQTEMKFSSFPVYTQRYVVSIRVCNSLRNGHEKNRSHHQTLQTRGRQRSIGRCGRGGHDGFRGERFWPAEGPYRDLSRQRIHRRFSSEDQSRNR